MPHPVNANHNGGTILFGPDDGYLYWSIGDGGSGGDPPNNAQNLNVLLGKILRLDVNRDDFPNDPARNYGIPDDNPFVGKSGADEIWDFGLRNPWRMSFDPATGDLYIGDVGQNTREEIDFEPAGSGGGRNYGWRKMEGTLGTKEPGMILPIFDYGHDLGNVVTGGEVYRGPGHALQGAYFFADFGSNRVWTLKVSHGEATGVTDRTDQIVSSDGPLQNISSFGTDGHGELYAVTLGGTIFHIHPTRLSGDVGDHLSAAPATIASMAAPGTTAWRAATATTSSSAASATTPSRDPGGKDIRSSARPSRQRRLRLRHTARRNQERRPDRRLLARQRPHAAQAGCVPRPCRGRAPGRGLLRGAAAHDGDDRIVYNSATGNLFFDPDGNGPAAAVRFAHLAAGLALSSGDFLVG